MLGACQDKGTQDEGDQLNIVTSFYPIYAMTKEVTGDPHHVKMIQSGTGIDGFEPSASDIEAINEANIFIYHSRALESWRVL